MTNIEEYNRERALQERFNSFIEAELNLPQKDYYSMLSARGILRLKSALSDINNILTMKVSISFIEWLSKALKFDEDVKEAALKIALETKPNTNGYDVWLGYPICFVAEVKCNIPVNKGNVYGSAQRKGIEKDLEGLLNGKRKSSILPHKCLKFFAFIDLPEVRHANKHLALVNAMFKEYVHFAPEGAKLARTDIIYGVYV